MKENYWILLLRTVY